MLHPLPTLRRKGYQGRSPWLVCALRLVPIRATCEHWPRFIRSPRPPVFGGLLCRFSARGHRSEIMLGVLVVVFCPDYIAGLGLGLGYRAIPLIVSLRVSRAPRFGAGDIRCPLLRAVSKWPRRLGAVRTHHCFLAILHGSLLGNGRGNMLSGGRTGIRASGIYAALARVRPALFAVRKFPRESAHDFRG